MDTGHADACSICLEAAEGSGTLALPCGHRFHAACLAQVAGLRTPTRRGTVVACPNCRKRSLVAPFAPAAAFGVGDAVLALWGHRWYPGVVEEVVDGGQSYEIVWDDGDVGRVLASRVRRNPAQPCRTTATRVMMRLRLRLSLDGGRPGRSEAGRMLNLRGCRMSGSPRPLPGLGPSRATWRRSGGLMQTNKPVNNGKNGKGPICRRS